MEHRNRTRRLLGAAGLASILGLALAAVAAEDLIPLPLKLPREAFAGTPPEPPAGVREEDLDKTPKPRPVPMVPAGIAQLALTKPVTASLKPFSGSLDQITDGLKEAYEDTFMALRGKTQWVQVDLGASHPLYHIVVWHYHLDPIITHDVIVQVSDDPSFGAGVTTLFNNDRDNSSGLGEGKAKEYWETNEGKLIGCGGVKARYVRLYSRGSTWTDTLNRYTEVEVWGL
ncbi:MAG: hypothetical protein HZB16_23010 [Armatimonadetes bacterium]|nr:hypothetical protein [Armatimonadota bacterium]